MMLANLLQFVLGQENNGTEGIIEILIFAFLIVAGIIKSLFTAKQEQKQKGIQKRPAQRPSSQKAPATAEKIRMQRERYEQFLESILQPKKSVQQQHKPKTPVSQTAGTKPVPNVTKAPVAKVYTNQPVTNATYNKSYSATKRSQADDLLDTRMHDMPVMDTKIEHIPQFQEEHIQEDQRHLIAHKKTGEVFDTIQGNKLFSFSDSDDLKKAILYTEVLGRPISLRETEALFD